MTLVSAPHGTDLEPTHGARRLAVASLGTGRRIGGQPTWIAPRVGVRGNHLVDHHEIRGDLGSVVDDQVIGNGAARGARGAVVGLVHHQVGKPLCEEGRTAGEDERGEEGGEPKVATHDKVS